MAVETTGGRGAIDRVQGASATGDRVGGEPREATRKASGGAASRGGGARGGTVGGASERQGETDGAGRARARVTRSTRG